MTLLQSAVTRPFIQKPSDLQLERSGESLLVNSIAENVLTKLVDDVFIEAEKIMGNRLSYHLNEKLYNFSIKNNDIIVARFIKKL